MIRHCLSAELPIPALNRRAHALTGSKRSLCKSGQDYPSRAVWDRTHLSAYPCPVLSTIAAGASWCSSNALTFKIIKATMKETNLLTGLAVFTALSLVICIQLEERLLLSHLFPASPEGIKPTVFLCRIQPGSHTAFPLQPRSLPGQAGSCRE